MGLEIFILSDISQRKTSIIDYVYVEWCKWTCLKNRNRLRDTENEHGHQRGNGETKKLGVWDYLYGGFPGGSEVKPSACNAGDHILLCV